MSYEMSTASIKRKTYSRFKLMDTDAGGDASFWIRRNPFASIVRRKRRINDFWCS